MSFVSTLYSEATCTLLESGSAETITTFSVAVGSREQVQ